MSVVTARIQSAAGGCASSARPPITASCSTQTPGCCIRCGEAAPRERASSKRFLGKRRSGRSPSAWRPCRAKRSSTPITPAHLRCSAITSRALLQPARGPPRSTQTPSATRPGMSRSRTVRHLAGRLRSTHGTRRALHSRLGRQPSASAPHQHDHWLPEAPGKVIVVDPVRTPTAAAADLHLAPFPGSDAALAFALAHVIRRDGLLDASSSNITRSASASSSRCSGLHARVGRTNHGRARCAHRAGRRDVRRRAVVALDRPGLPATAARRQRGARSRSSPALSGNLGKTGHGSAVSQRSRNRGSRRGLPQRRRAAQRRA